MPAIALSVSNANAETRKRESKESMTSSVVLPFALVASAVVIRLAIPIARRIGLVDKPGGHKAHEGQVPLVGGVGIYVAVTSVLLIGAFAQPDAFALFGSLFVF